MAKEFEGSLGGEKTFQGQNKPKADDLDTRSLGDQATFAGGKPVAREQSLGDQMTFGGGASEGYMVDDGMEVVDLSARYKIEKTLGKGGMGEVLLATDTRLERKVAIKRILGEAARSRTAINRFLTEAKSIAALNHPNIVQIYDYGRATDGPFLIMEFVDGESLLDRTHGGALPLEEAVELTCQLCDGLAKAHDAGIIHRDIKPANVLLSKDGIPKLTDFGLAKAESADTGMTMAGAVLGTLDFMPPEQRRDAALTDARSDLWSLAASLYQLVTGKSPKIIKFNEVPKALQEVLGKALEDSKDDRYQTARDFKQALKQALAAGTEVALETGDCPQCGTKNEASRKFCKKCAQSLEVGCLSCKSRIPMWEEVCGNCGAQQSGLVVECKQNMANSRVEAERLLEQLEFDKATQLATKLGEEPDLRLRQLQGWSEKFLLQVQKTQKEQNERVSALVAEALKHRAAFDYPAAVHALEQVPAPLLNLVLSGQSETVAELLDDARGQVAEYKRLEKLIKERIDNRHFNGLLAAVEKLLKLKPEKADALKLRAQLIERDTKNQARVQEIVQKAQQLRNFADFSGALNLLHQISAEFATVASQELLEECTELDGMRGAAVQMLDRAASTRDFSSALAVAAPYGERLGALGIKDQAYVQLDQQCKAGLASQQLEEERRQKKARKVMYVLLAAAGMAVLAGGIFAFNSISASIRAAALKTALEQEEWDKALEIEPENVNALVGRAVSRFAKKPPELEAGFADLTKAEEIQPNAAGLAPAKAAGFTKRANALAEAGKTAEAEKDYLQAKVLGAGAAELESSSGLLAAAFIKEAEQVALNGNLSQAMEKVNKALEYDSRSAPPAALLELAADSAIKAFEQAGTDANLTAATEAIEKLGGSAAELRKGDLLLRLGQVLLTHSRTRDSTEKEKSAADLNLALKFGVPAAEVKAVKEELARGYAEPAIRLFEQSDSEPNFVSAKKALDNLKGTDGSQKDIDEFSTRIRSVLIARFRKAIPQDIPKAREDLKLARDYDLSSSDSEILQIELAAGAKKALEQKLENKNWVELPSAYEMLLAIDATAAKEFAEEITDRIGPEDFAKLPLDFISDLPPKALVKLPPEVFGKLPPIRNSIGMELRWLPAGKFEMRDGISHGPLKVSLSKPFYLGVHEVTQEQYERVMGANPSDFKGSQNPVENVTWDDAVEFCKKLSARPEEQAAGRIYRLPTEAEWEYACRAGSKTEYCFGDSEGELAEYAWFANNSGNKPLDIDKEVDYSAAIDSAGVEKHPVGQKKANAWGLHDMHGNVEEWCADWFARYPKDAADDPVGPNAGTFRIRRGGDFRSAPLLCCSGSRGNGYPGIRNDSVGFRVALSFQENSK